MYQLKKKRAGKKVLSFSFLISKMGKTASPTSEVVRAGCVNRAIPREKRLVQSGGGQ